MKDPLTFSAVSDWFFYLSTYWLETCHKSSQCITEGYQADKKYPRCHGFSKYQLSLHSTLTCANEWIGCEMEGKLIFWKSAALILQSDAFISFRLSILWIMPSFKSICPEIKKNVYSWRKFNGGYVILHGEYRWSKIFFSNLNSNAVIF